MPWMPKKRCGHPQCPEFVNFGEGYCIRHKRQMSKQVDINREATRDPFYKSTAWRKTSRLVIAQQPICAICNEKPSALVDHIKPISQGGDRLSRENLQGLCYRCHARKTASETKLKNETRRGVKILGDRLPSDHCPIILHPGAKLEPEGGRK